MLEFSISNQLLSRLDTTTVVADSQNYLECSFQFSEDWADVEPVASFGHGGVDKPLSVRIVDGVCRVPHEVITPYGFQMAVYGTGNGGDAYTHIPTNVVTVEVERGGSQEGLTPAQPTQDLYDTLMDKLHRSEQSAVRSQTSAAANAAAAQAAAQGVREDAQRAERAARSCAEDAAAAMGACKEAERQAAQGQNLLGKADRLYERMELAHRETQAAAGAAKDSETAAQRYAAQAMAEVDRAKVPAVQGVYNVVLQDRTTGERYALMVDHGGLKLLGVDGDLDAVEPALIDRETGTAHTLVVEGGTLKLEEA